MICGAKRSFYLVLRRAGLIIPFEGRAEWWLIRIEILTPG